MSILIVGGAGYIGSQTAKRVAQAGLEPVVFDNLVYGHEWAVKWGPLVEGDLADGALIKRVLEEHEVTAVMHFAAYAYVGESVTNPRKYFRNNVVSTLNLLDAMVDAGVRDIVFSSTCATYGEPARVPIAEDHPAEPGQPLRRDEAGVEKCARLVRSAPTRSGSRRCATSTRPAPIPTASSARTTIPRRTSSRSPSRRRWAARAWRSSAPTTRRPTAPRSATTSTCRISADAHVAALDKLRDGATSLSVNLGTGRGHSVREVIAAVEKVSGKKVPAREAGRRAGDPPALVADARARRRRPGLEGAHSQHRDHRRARLALAAEGGGEV